MKYHFTTLILCILSTTLSFAQKQLTLEELWSGAYQSTSMQAVNALKNSNQYARIELNSQNKSQEINLYDFKTLEKSKTIFTTQNHPSIENIDAYVFDDREEKMLISTHSEPIYRHSSVATYLIYDLQSKKIKSFTDRKISEPTFSKDGTKVAYAFENNLYIYDLQSEKTITVTTDGKKNHIINGISDWVYEEEFAVVRMFEWSIEGDKLAYVRFDETNVPEYSMDIYGNELYPTQQVFKYPKAGEENAKVSLHLYDLQSQKSNTIDLSEFHDFYIPRIKWTNDNNYLSFQVINRHQNDLKLYFVDAKSIQKKLILNEKDPAYVDITDHLTFLKDNSFVWTSEKDGYNHLYHFDKNGKQLNQITKGNWDITSYYGIDEKSKTLYYQSVERGSTTRDIYAIQINGTAKRILSKETGTNSAVFSPDFNYFILSHSSHTNPISYTLNNSKDGKLLKNILDNKKLLDKLELYQLPKKEFFTIPTENNWEMNAWIMKPKDFDPSKKYPILMYQYSGPGSQQVANKWWDSNDFWHAMLTQKGYIVVAVDGRGTGFKGADFKKTTQNQLGKLEVEDQIIAAKYLKNINYIDAARIGIWGWSFGGFMSSNCLLKANDIFKTAIAVAPVTNWRYYDTVYTERYLKTPQENPSGYDNNSPIFFANQLKGNFLLIHGSADDNVHVQNSMAMIESLVQENKTFDWLIYPDKNHGIYGGQTRLHLYTKMTNYILEKL